LSELTTGEFYPIPEDMGRKCDATAYANSTGVTTPVVLGDGDGKPEFVAEMATAGSAETTNVAEADTIPQSIALKPVTIEGTGYTVTNGYKGLGLFEQNGNELDFGGFLEPSCDTYNY
jgi:hypothetical protein